MPETSSGTSSGTSSPSDARVRAASSRLYAVVPEEFVATRTRLVTDAREAGDRTGAAAIAKLRRPSVAAWTLNVLVRERPDLSARVAEVGSSLRDAQSRVDASRLTTLRPERDALLEDVARAAAELAAAAGRRLTPAVLDEVRGSVIAALAGEEATAAFRSGSLTRALSYSGFGEVDLADAVVRTGSGAILSVIEGAQTEGRRQGPAGEPGEDATAGGAGGAAPPGEDIGRVVEAAQQALHRAQADLEEADRAARAARQRAEHSLARVAELERALAAAREADRATRADVTAAARARKEAQRAHAAAEKALARARTSAD